MEFAVTLYNICRSFPRPFVKKEKKIWDFYQNHGNKEPATSPAPAKRKKKAPPLLNSKTGAALVRTTVKATYFKKRISSIAALVSPSTFSLPVVKASTGSSLPFTNFIKLVPLMISRALRSW